MVDRGWDFSLGGTDQIQKFLSIDHVHFVVDMEAMPFHSSRTDTEPVSDLPGGMSPTEKDTDFRLPGAEGNHTRTHVYPPDLLLNTLIRILYPFIQ